MKEITCPNCHTTFKMEGSEYAEIVAQIRNEAFEEELQRSIQNSVQKRENELNSAFMKKLSESEDRERRLSSQLEMLSAKLKEQENEQNTVLKREVEKLRLEKELEIQALKGKLENSENEKRLALQTSMQEMNTKLFESQNSIMLLKQDLKARDAEHELELKNTKSSFENMLKMKDEEIARYKDYKAKLSTKLIGESLEQHCLIEFNRLRATAFQDAYFDKDNDSITSGTKGDFIFRDYSDGVEYISIMFEMKNEMDEDVSKSKKHKNEDFFAKLDKDRRDKGCEYAVLVTMLEPESELYNAGIVDVSYMYEKMYVIRPQFFIPIISVLRNAARSSIAEKKELALARSQNIDIENFVSKLQDFKDKFGHNYDLACTQFQKAIDQIDNSIKALQSTKDFLLKSQNNLRLANDKTESLTLKRLTKDSPSLKAQIEDLL